MNCVLFSPSIKSAFRLVTAVVEVTVRGAVPVATVEMSCVPVMVPVVEVLVSERMNCVLFSPSIKSAFRLVTTVVEVTDSGAVPDATVETNLLASTSAWVPENTSLLLEASFKKTNL